MLIQCEINVDYHRKALRASTADVSPRTNEIKGEFLIVCLHKKSERFILLIKDALN